MEGFEDKQNRGLIIFDFDGTLGDTRRNIVTTMQMTIAELHLPSRSEEECAAIVETTIKVSSIGQSRHQATYSRMRQTMTADVVIANRPESVVASPYVGRKNGNIVMMKMPKPKPVVRCTKLAPMLSRNMAITILLIINNHKSGRKATNLSFLYYSLYQFS